MKWTNSDNLRRPENFSSSYEEELWDRAAKIPSDPKAAANIPNSPQLFIIGSETINSMSWEEVQATVEDLKTLGLYRLPYETVDLKLPAAHFLRLYNEETGDIRRVPWTEEEAKTAVLTVYGISIEPGRPVKSVFTWEDRPKWKGENVTAYSNQEFVRNTLADGLITLLATRNAVKSTREHKLAKLGIGKERHQYVTTISVPRELEKHESNPTGIGRCPHLRRGHIRRQHYGPKNSFVKPIWIEPVFVNADKEFVSTRTAYNVSL